MKKLFESILFLLLISTTIYAGQCTTTPPFDSGRILTDGEIIYLDSSSDKVIVYDYDVNSKNFTEVLSFSRRIDTSYSLECANINNVGTDEIIIADATDDDIHIYNFREGRLEDIGHFDKGIEGYDDIAVGDVNRDGEIEIILGDASVDSSSGHSIKVFDKNGNEIGYIQVSGGYERYDRVAAGDVDGDGYDEIVFGDASSDNIIIYDFNLGNPGRFKLKNQFPVDYSREDEIAVADVNGDGIDEIIFAEGHTGASIPENKQKILIYDVNGTKLGASPNIDFRSQDTLTAGDITMNGRAEIIVGKESDGMIHVYEIGNDFSFRELGAFYVGYKYGEKLAVGDLNGGSIIVGEPNCRGQLQINDEVIAVINAPPKHNGINYESGNFYVTYEHSQTQSTSNTVKAVTGFNFSAGLSYKHKFGIVDVEASLEVKYGESHISQSGTKFIKEIGEGVTADMTDRMITISSTYDVYEYPVLDNDGSQIIENGEPQFLLVTVPVSVGTPTLQNYNSSLHTLGNIKSYPSQINDLLNYPHENIYEVDFLVSQDPSTSYIYRESSNFNYNESSSEIKVSTKAAVGAWGATLSLAGDYSQKKITTHKIEFTDSTKIKISYEGGINEIDKEYNAHAVAYYDSEDGHLVLDWLVPAYGDYYKSSGGVGNLGNIGFIWNGNFIINPYIVNPGFNFQDLFGITLPMPHGANFYSYNNNGQTERNEDAGNCKPIGYNITSDKLTVFVDLPKFENPVDLYFGLYMPDIDSENIYLLNGDNEIITVSQGLEPWLTFTSGNLVQNIFSEIPVSIIPEGTYYFYLLACPGNSQNPLQDYYLWGTSYIK